MSLFSAIDHFLLGGNKSAAAKPAPAPAQQPASDNGRTLLGIRPTTGGPTPLVYTPVRTPTPTVTPNAAAPLQMYGDAQGNRWLEDTAGNRFNVPQAPQAYDTQLNNSYHDPLRPGQTGPFPTSDGVFHPAQPLPLASRFRSV